VLGASVDETVSRALKPGSVVTLKAANEKYCNSSKQSTGCRSKSSSSLSSRFEVVSTGGGYVALKSGGCWNSDNKRVACKRGDPEIRSNEFRCACF
jgi:hypothetical protein